MEDYPLVNRCAIIITPNSPFWEWVKQTGDEEEELLIEFKREGNIYLVPDYESEEDVYAAIEKYVVANYTHLFIIELEAWYTDPAAFPEITYERFKEWFNVSSYTMIFDMVKKPLRKQ